MGPNSTIPKNIFWGSLSAQNIFFLKELILQAEVQPSEVVSEYCAVLLQPFIPPPLESRLSDWHISGQQKSCCITSEASSETRNFPMVPWAC